MHRVHGRGRQGLEQAGKLSRHTTVSGTDISPGDVTLCHIGDLTNPGPGLRAHKTKLFSSAQLLSHV